MKKIVALLLAVMMLLASVSVLAESPTPETPVVNPPEDAIAYIIEVPDRAMATEYKTKIAESTPLVELFDEEIAGKVTAVVGEDPALHALVSLMVVDEWEPSIGGCSVELVFDDIDYKAGTPIVVVLVLVKDGALSFEILDATVTADHVVTVSFPVDVMERSQQADEMFVVIASEQ